MTAADLAGREAGQERERSVDVSGVDRPRPRCEQVVLLGAEPDSPEHLVPAAAMFPDLPEEAGVVAGVAGPPPFGLAGLVEAFLAVLADRLQQPVSALWAGLLGHHQRTCHQARQQLEYRAGIDILTTAYRLSGLQGAAAREHSQSAQQPLLGLGEQLKGPVDRGPQRLVTFHR